jgi:hypothetical protein
MSTALRRRRALIAGRRCARVRLLVALVGELSALDLVVMVDNITPAVRIRTGLIVPVLYVAVLYVAVDPSGGYFEWCGGYNRHPAHDPHGAAERIADYIDARAALWAGALS